MNRYAQSLEGRRWFLAASFGLLAVVGSLGAVAITRIGDEAVEPVTVSKEIAEKGARLRRDIERAYRVSRSKNTLKPGATRGLDIADVVERWIPVGTSFDDAEAILKAAHFKIEERPSEAKPPQSPFWRNHPGRFAVGAKLILESNVFSTVDIGVALYPEIPYRYAHVHRLEATLFLISI
ncbi:MAG: hypothetical protein JWQ58_385 [Reyranella sp.]|nr:hypothetical protein [Reyranella sp.]